MHGVREKYANEQQEKAMNASINKSQMDPEEMRQKGLI